MSAGEFNSSAHLCWINRVDSSSPYGGKSLVEIAEKRVIGRELLFASADQTRNVAFAADA